MPPKNKGAIERWREDHDKSVAPSLGHTGEFWGVILRLFKVLLQAAKTAPSLTFPAELFPQFVRELQRFYFWGDGFSASQGRLDEILDRSPELRQNTLLVLEQLGQTLSIDLRILLHPTPSWEHHAELVSATGEFDEIHQKWVIALLVTEEAKVDRDMETGSSAGSASSEPELDADDILADITTYNDCLMDLCDALENSSLDRSDDKLPATELEVFAVPPEAQLFCRRIREQYRSLPKYLVERLGTLNAARHSQIRFREERFALNQHDPTLMSGSRSCVSGEPPSEDLLSGAGTATTATGTSRESSLFGKVTAPHEQDSDGGDSISTCRTTDSAIIQGRARVPPMPEQAHRGEPFICTVCYSEVTGVTSRREWKKHVFADLRPYCCIFEECPCVEQGAAVLHQSSKEWSRQEHRLGNVNWKSQSCPFCDPSSHWDDRKDFFNHVSRHLREVAVAALPATSFEDGDDDGDSCGESEAEVEAEVKEGPGQAIAENLSRFDRPGKKPAATSPRRHFSCPFYKFDSTTYRTCGKMILRYMSDVRVHLLRTHYEAVFCPACKLVFVGRSRFKMRDDHLTLRECYPNPSPDPIRITPEKLELIRGRHGMPEIAPFPDLSHTERRWYGIWQICFPGSPFPRSVWLDESTDPNSESGDASATRPANFHIGHGDPPSIFGPGPSTAEMARFRITGETIP